MNGLILRSMTWPFRLKSGVVVEKEALGCACGIEVLGALGVEVCWLSRGIIGQRVVCERGILKTFAKEARTGDVESGRIVSWLGFFNRWELLVSWV